MDLIRISIIQEHPWFHGRIDKFWPLAWFTQFIDEFMKLCEEFMLMIMGMMMHSPFNSKSSPTDCSSLYIQHGRFGDGNCFSRSCKLSMMISFKFVAFCLRLFLLSVAEFYWMKTGWCRPSCLNRLFLGFAWCSWEDDCNLHHVFRPVCNLLIVALDSGDYPLESLWYCR